jgi:hypothetical protein
MKRKYLLKLFCNKPKFIREVLVVAASSQQAINIAMAQISDIYLCRVIGIAEA